MKTTKKSTSPTVLSSVYLCRKSKHFEICNAFYLFLPYSTISRTSGDFVNVRAQTGMLGSLTFFFYRILVIQVQWKLSALCSWITEPVLSHILLVTNNLPCMCQRLNINKWIRNMSLVQLVEQCRLLENYRLSINDK